MLSGLATCDPDFHIVERDRLIEQYKITLNLLQVNSKLSAWAYINGVFDFNKNLLAPPGTKIFFNSKPDQPTSWAFYGVEG